MQKTGRNKKLPTKGSLQNTALCNTQILKSASENASGLGNKVTFKTMEQNTLTKE